MDVTLILLLFLSTCNASSGINSMFLAVNLCRSIWLTTLKLWNLSFPQITQTLFFFRSASTDYYPDHTFWAISVYVLLVVFVFLLARRCANAGRPTSYGPVSVSVTNQCSIKTVKRIGLFLARKLPSTYITLCFKEIQVPSKIRALPSGTLLQTRSGLKKFRHSISIVETCYRLSSKKVDAQSVINWTVVGQLSW